MIDWVMTVLFVAGSCCLTMAISFGGLVYGYGSGSEITLWVVTGVLLILTILAAKYHPGVGKADRLYPVHFFKNPVVLNMQVQIFLSSGIILVSGNPWFGEGRYEEPPPRPPKPLRKTKRS